MSKKVQNAYLKINAIIYIFAFITWIVFCFVHPKFEDLTKEIYDFLFYTPLGILLACPFYYSEKSFSKDDGYVLYMWFPCIWLLTLICDYRVWKFLFQ